jgi:hypothetical protein
VTRDGPMLYALLIHFGFVKQSNNQKKLKMLDQELVCKAIIEFEKFKLNLLKLDNAREWFKNLEVTYNEKGMDNKPGAVFGQGRCTEAKKAITGCKGSVSSTRDPQAFHKGLLHD